ncbi:putative ABC transport system ATP-binding protein/putative ABC transport system ATP-binding protein [Melghiribacillus thermohalophilus]|uniref:Putative ABC transport system ATP-binding protein/putative ABC transport system ATP-binding protein n=1 Tax=Melghiribacillus thermohalophilus TaxID=1324956 RepID=A0A4R3MUH9_9BACI|nr:ABC transporter ATP-binding protein [Melghiribacillus thermohalophilus]TCT17938.1 putative ABC transport system ATP-binding protein/putative ABC transport system ATP-binding protein [Melghiribacillus thermohalophilus]
MNVLKAENLSKIYGKRSSLQVKAIDNISLTVKKGEFIGVMGPSGSGKTTLLHLLSTIDSPTSGSVEINGKQISSMTDGKLAKFRRREMGFVFQDFNLLDTLTIEENILLPMTLDHQKIRDMEKRLMDVSRKLEIESILKKRTYEVSGGQMQRAAIARAIIHDPSIIFADEPTGNLDSRSSEQVMESFQMLHEEQEATILMVTHDPFAASFCERIVFIKDGRIYTEIYRGDNRQSFFQDILNVMSILGGNTDDFQTVRV